MARIGYHFVEKHLADVRLVGLLGGQRDKKRHARNACGYLKGETMNRMDRVVATRVPDDIAKRLDALAAREMRKVGAMVRILIKEALSARECTAAIRRAFKHVKLEERQ